MAPRSKTTRLAAASPGSIAAAAACLRAGGLVAVPTETVYGLAADATSDAAVATIYAAKDRPAINPLIAHVLDLEAAREHAVFGPEAERLANAFWPGPLTLVLPVAPTCRISLLARAGLDTVALRSPAHETARALIEAAGAPLAAPSANRSGRVSATTAAHVVADLDGRVDWILDGGPCRYGLESTILEIVSGLPRLLRPGAITREAIESALGSPIESAGGSPTAPNAPGQLASHYAPNAELRLGAAEARAGEAALDFGGLLKESAAGARLDLSPAGDLVDIVERVERAHEIDTGVARVTARAHDDGTGVAAPPGVGLLAGDGIDDDHRQRTGQRLGGGHPARLTRTARFCRPGAAGAGARPKFPPSD